MFPLPPYPNFPNPADRTFSNYQPSAQTNNKIVQSERITNNWEYRQYLQKNATKIMNLNYMTAKNEVGLPPLSKEPPQQNTPFIFSNLYETVPINKIPTSNYQFQPSDLLQSYLNEEQTKTRIVAPSVNPKKWIR